MKTKQANKKLQESFRLDRIEGEIVCEEPNNQIYSFNGLIKMKNLNNEMIPLDIDNLLLRGSTLKSTEYVIGAVIFTGHQTKVMQNNSRGK